MSGGIVKEVATVTLAVGWADDDYKYDDHPNIRHWDKKSNQGVDVVTVHPHDCTGTDDGKRMCLFDYVLDCITDCDFADVYSNLPKIMEIAQTGTYTQYSDVYFAEVEMTLELTLEWSTDYFGEYDEWAWFSLPSSG